MTVERGVERLRALSEAVVSWMTGRIWIPERLFDWMLRRKVERKGYRGREVSEDWCKCWFPKPWPIYWNGRCLRYDGWITGPISRWQLRKESK